MSEQPSTSSKVHFRQHEFERGINKDATRLAGMVAEEEADRRELLADGYTELADIYVPKTKFAGRENNETSCRLAVREDYFSEGIVDRVYRFAYTGSYCCIKREYIAISDTMQQEGSFQVEALLAAVVDYIGHREDDHSKVALHLLKTAQEILTTKETTANEGNHG